MSYAEDIKPFNFISHVSLAGFCARPVGVPLDVAFNLIAPYLRDPREALRCEWTNLHQPDRTYRIATVDGLKQPEGCLVRTYADMLRAYQYHPEAKSLGPDGLPCGQQTVGVLAPQHICASEVVHIGKEANALELVQSGIVTNEAEVLNTYGKDAWDSLAPDVVPVLKRIRPRFVRQATGYDASMVNRIRNGKRKPAKEKIPELVAIAAAHLRKEYTELGYADLPQHDLVMLRWHSARAKTEPPRPQTAQEEADLAYRSVMMANDDSD